MLSRIDEKLWKTGWYIYYPLYILSLIGFNFIAPKYLTYFSAIVKVYISLLLLWKFNPLKTPKPVTNYDREVIFSAGTFLLLTTVIGDILMAHDAQVHDQFEIALKGLKFMR